MKTDNPMRNIRIEKITLNFGAGKDQAKLEKGLVLLHNITGITPVKTFTQKRIPNWGIRPGLPIGCKVTLRKKNAEELLDKLLQAKDKQLKHTQFDNSGNLSFGIEEYVDIPGVKYDPSIKILGLEVCVTLARPGFRIKRRKLNARKIHKNHSISRQEAMHFMKIKYQVNITEEENQ